MNGRVLAIMLATVSVADASPHRNAGTYTLTRGVRSPSTFKGAVVPMCKPDQTVPTELIIKYSGPDAPVVLVNGEEFQRGGLTVGPDGKPQTRPLRVATKPHPSAGTDVSVAFRRDESKAIGTMHVYRSAPGQRGYVCVTGFYFEGTYSP